MMAMTALKLDTEQERLAFVRTISQVMVTRAHLDVNTKKIYMADVNSVSEMMKLAKFIFDALKLTSSAKLLLSKSTTLNGEEVGGDESLHEQNLDTFDKNQVNIFKDSFFFFIFIFYFLL